MFSKCKYFSKLLVLWNIFQNGIFFKAVGVVVSEHLTYEHFGKLKRMNN